MMVPRSRLLWLVALVLIPCAGMIGLGGAWVLPGVLGAAAVLLMALFDYWRGHSALNQVTIEMAPLIRFSKGRSGVLPVTLVNGDGSQRRIRVGLPLPDEFQTEAFDQWVSVPADQELSRIEWTCTPILRGSFPLSACYLESPSPLGLWGRRTALRLDTELRVYPDLLRERKTVAALFLNRGGVGIHAQRQVGQGRDFEQLRSYIAGDSLNDVHWKASAKRGHLVTKQYRVERTQEIYVVIDGSRLSARQAIPDYLQSEVKGGEVITVLERFITAGLILGVAAEKQGDQFGVLSFNNKIQSFVRAKSGSKHYQTCRDGLYHLQPQSVSPDFDELCTYIRLKLRKRALLIFLTSLDDPLLAEQFTRSVELVSRRHLVIVGMIQDKQTRPMFSGTVESSDDLYDHLGAHLRWRRLRELQKVLQRRGVRFHLLSNESICLELISQYMAVKQRQLL